MNQVDIVELLIDRRKEYEKTINKIIEWLLPISYTIFGDKGFVWIVFNDKNNKLKPKTLYFRYKITESEKPGFYYSKNGLPDNEINVLSLTLKYIINSKDLSMDDFKSFSIPEVLANWVDYINGEIDRINESKKNTIINKFIGTF